MITLTTDQKVNLKLNALTLTGKPANVDGVPLWSTSNANVISLVVSPNGLSAFAVASGAGSASVTVIADGDLTSGIKQLTTSVDLTVTQAGAASIVVTNDPPVAQ